MQIFELLREAQAPIFVVVIFLLVIYLISNPNKITGWLNLLDPQVKLREKLESDLRIRQLTFELSKIKKETNSQKSPIEEANELISLLNVENFSKNEAESVAALDASIFRSWPPGIY